MRPPKEGPTPPISDDYYIKSICPSGGHGRGHRLALQNRAAARHMQLTVNLLTYLLTYTFRLFFRAHIEHCGGMCVHGAENPGYQ